MRAALVFFVFTALAPLSARACRYRPVDSFTLADEADSIVIAVVERSALRVERVIAGRPVTRIELGSRAIMPAGPGPAPQPPGRCGWHFREGDRVVVIGPPVGPHSVRLDPSDPRAAEIEAEYVRVLGAWSAARSDDERATLLVGEIARDSGWAGAAGHRLLADPRLRSRITGARLRTLMRAARTSWTAGRVLARMHVMEAVPALIAQLRTETQWQRARYLLERLTNHALEDTEDFVGAWRRWWRANRGRSRHAILSAGFRERGVRVRLDDRQSLREVTVSADLLSRVVAADLCEDLTPVPDGPLRLRPGYHYTTRTDEMQSVRCSVH